VKSLAISGRQDERDGRKVETALTVFAFAFVGSVEAVQDVRHHTVPAILATGYVARWTAGVAERGCGVRFGLVTMGKTCLGGRLDYWRARGMLAIGYVVVV
jgi:hypothetical protein